MSLHNIGLIHSLQGDNELAIENYTKALKIQREIGDNRGSVYSLNHLGDIEMENGNIKEGYPRGAMEEAAITGNMHVWGYLLLSNNIEIGVRPVRPNLSKYT